MFKKFLSLMLVGLLMQVGFIRLAAAKTRADKSAQAVEKVKAAVTKIGTGLEAQAEVKLHDNTKLRGYISEAKEDSFTIVDSSTDTPQTVAYMQVKQVKRIKGGSDLSLSFDGGVEIAIAGAVVAAIIIIGVVVAKGTR